MFSIKRTMDIVREFHQKSGMPVLSNTSVVSPLFSGQFCYCLDEIHWYEKYGNLIDIEIGDDFQKIQPAIRLRDFEAYCLGRSESLQHLGLFSLATINGGNVVAQNDSVAYYVKSAKGMLKFFSSIGLDISRLKVTYFSGNTAEKIEMSRKKEGQKRKILVEKYIPEDNFKEVLLECGLEKNQLEGVGTRDNYLTTNWFQCVAPWGYRNEFLYLMPNGEYMDIGTIERLGTKPTIADVNGSRCVVEIEDWEKSLIIDAAGIERSSMCVEGVNKISNISLLEPLHSFIRKNTNLPDYEVGRIREALRILHRVFTDVNWEGLGKHKDRKAHVKSLMKICKNLSLDLIADFLYLHAKQYQIIFPDLRHGVERTVSEIENYRRRVK